MTSISMIYFSLFYSSFLSFFWIKLVFRLQCILDMLRCGYVSEFQCVQCITALGTSHVLFFLAFSFPALNLNKRPQQHLTIQQKQQASWHRLLFFFFFFHCFFLSFLCLFGIILCALLLQKKKKSVINIISKRKKKYV